MSEYLKDETADIVTINDLKLFSLLFADDTVVFSESQEGLQSLLNRINVYCNKWGITVNTDKTVVMVFKNGTHFQEAEVYYDDHRLKTVSKFTYLGVTVSFNGKFFQTQKSLSEQALKAFFSLNSLFSIVSLDISEKAKLFDAMVLPILNFSSEVWGFHPSPDIERVHLKFLKQNLKVKAQTCSAAVYGEFGRVPLNVQRKCRILKYWFNIMKSPGTLKFNIFP